ncbi:MAG: acetoacetate--CoA ligase, partial [Verrucomicrobia bacterium]|nr:acetoacetate--CoA ligase [Verrucomicrobiota bacterium]
MASAPQFEVLWRPDLRLLETCNLKRYLQFLEDKHRLRFQNYQDLYNWSITDLENFWRSIAEFFEVRFHSAAERVLLGQESHNAHWFPGATLNYAEHLLQRIHQRPKEVLIISALEGQSKSERRRLTGAELADQIAGSANALRGLGVEKGDRVCGYLPNCPETV